MNLSARIILSSLLIAGPAFAQTHIALPRFDASPAGDAFFGVQSPRDIEHLGLRARATFDWADKPLVLRSTDDDENLAELARRQAILDLGAAFDLWQRITVSASLPIALSQTGQGGLGDVPSADGAHVGDLRVGARVLLWQASPLLRFSVAGNLWLPLGGSGSAANAYLSDHRARGRVELVAHGDSGRLVWAFAAGPDLRRAQRFVNVELGNAIRVSAAAGVRFFDQRLQVGPEATGSFRWNDSDRFNRNVEALLGVRYHERRGLDAGVAAGPGFTSGIGTPDFRVVASIGYAFGWDAPVPAPAPAPTPAPAPAPAPQPQPAPEPPVAPAPPEAPAPDRDADGVADARDACVDVPGDAEHDGCPAVLDTDGDGIVEEVDACPADAGVADADPARNGCPAARIVGDQIIIMDQIQFETNKSVIKADSEVVLTAILKSINSLPQATRFIVEGHTDNRGGAKRNKVLSEGRAQAVVAWLASHGVDASRLEAHGYGPSKPIANNKTEAGRKANRRVEIHIVR